MRIPHRRTLVVAVILSTALMTLVAYAWPIREPYHPLNEAWNGCSKISHVTQNLTVLVSYHATLPTGLPLLAIIGPSIEFSSSESSRIEDFLNSGGTVLLADDFGTGNSLLEQLDVPARFSKTTVADLLLYSKQYGFPFIVDFLASPVTVNVTVLLTNHPSYIEIQDPRLVTVLARSSSFSFIDSDGDDRPEVNQVIDSYPVIASVEVGEGSLILVSDPDIFVNEMIDLYDNMMLFQNIRRTGGGSLAFDVAHIARAPLTDLRTEFRSRIDSIRSSLLLSSWGLYTQFLIVAAVVLALFLHIRRNARIRAPGMKSQAF